MIQVVIDGKEINVKNQLSEITIGELEIINSEFQKGKNLIDKWANIFSYLANISKERVMELPHSQFLQMMNMMFTKDITDSMVKEIELNGVKYIAKEEPSASDLSLAEKLIIERNTNQLSLLIASQFVAEDGSSTNKFSDIEKRAELIREVPSDKVVRYAFSSVINFLEFTAQSNIYVK